MLLCWAMNMLLIAFITTKGNNPLTSLCLWLSYQEGSIVVTWLQEQLHCFVSADTCEQPPEQRRHIGTKRQRCHADKNNILLLFSSLENLLEQYQSTFPTGGGLKLKEAEADIRSLERTEFLFQTFVSTEAKVTDTETPPHL